MEEASNALLGDTDNSDLSFKKTNKINSSQLSLNKIHVNPNQPRTNFDTKEIDNLVVSIKELGLFSQLQLEKLMMISTKLYLVKEDIVLQK